LVIQVDDLDKQINSTKADILRGVSFTEDELNLLFQKITSRAVLNLDLEKVRKGEPLMCALIIILCYLDI